MAQEGNGRLSEKDRQEVMRAIERGESLDESFRFLLFDVKRQVELVWNGKTTNTCRAVLPFQTIERIDEPRAERPEDESAQLELFPLDERGRQDKGWTNKLIWGDNKLILSSLKSPQWRERIKAQGGLKLIYIDPPFDVGADFSMQVEVGERGDEVEKAPSVLELIAYRDTWGQGQDSFIAMIYERLSLMRDLLAEDGSIYVHCDYRVNSHIRLIMDEIFGKENFRNEIIWRHPKIGVAAKKFTSNTDTVFFYSRCENYDYQTQYSDEANELYNRWKKKLRNGVLYYKEAKNIKDSPAQSKVKVLRKKLERELRDSDVVVDFNVGNKKVIDNVWQFPFLKGNARENTGYPTQKPESILARIINASSNQGDLIADFFCGSGTLCKVAERLGRKWIASDIGRFAIHITRKRMIETQRELKANGKSYRAFEILNLGKYERQFYLDINPNLSKDLQEQQRSQKEQDYVEMILRAYRARSLANAAPFHGEKNGRMVYIGPAGYPLSRLDIDEIIQVCEKRAITKVDVLGFEFAMGLAAHVDEGTSGRSFSIALKYIPTEVLDKRAIDKNEVQFYDLAYIKAEAHVERGDPPKVAVALKNFVNRYDINAYHAKDAERIAKAIKKWDDWIDYWSVDYDYESKKEIVRIYQPDSEEYEEKGTGSYIFENEWQSFRSRKARKLLLRAPSREVSGAKFKVAVKVIDIFGNDTTAVLDVDSEKEAK